MSIASKWCSNFDNVTSVRSNYDIEFNRLNKYLSPSSVKFFQSKNGDGNVNRLEIFDGTPERASDDLASSLLGMLLNPLQDKFSLVPANKELRDSKIHKDQLIKAKNWIVDHLSRADTSFMKAMSSVLQNVVNYGDGPFFIYRDKKKKLVKFAALPKQEVYFQRDMYGDIINYYREIYMTPIQLKREFEAAGGDGNARYWKEINEKINTDPNDERKVINIVFERDDYKTRTLNVAEKKYASLWIDYDHKVLLKESGYDYFPFFAPAWRLSPGEDYGRGPGHRALPDIITLNLMEKNNLAAAEVMIKPPLIMPYDIMEDDVDLSPAAINYIQLSRAMFGTQFIKPEPLNVIQDLPISVQMQDRKRNLILLAFYNDLLQDDKRVEQSATESNNRMMSNIRKFSGPFSNLENDLLQAVIKEVYQAGIEFGEIEVDSELKDVNVAFTTAMYEAQQQMRLQALQAAGTILTQFFAGGIQIPGIKQELLAEYVFKATGADSNLLEDPEVARQQLEQQRQVQQDSVDTRSFKDVASGLKDIQQIV